jgi:hypothetical protein
MRFKHSLLFSFALSLCLSSALALASGSEAPFGEKTLVASAQHQTLQDARAQAQFLKKSDHSRGRAIALGPGRSV